MIYLSGTDANVPPHVGLMVQPGVRMGEARREALRRPWAADNGCFAAGAGFRLQFFENMLEALDDHRATCLFAVAPDVLGDAKATLARSLPALERIRAAFGYRAAFVAQDGQEALLVPWDELDCLFVGGTTAWKLSEPAYALAAEARARGKWTHMGRVNSERRLRAAAAAGYDSADGTFLRFGPDANRPRLEAWLRRLGPPLGLSARFDLAPGAPPI